MTTSLRSRPAPSGSPLRQALGRSARILRNLHDEQVYAWERLFRAGLPPQPDEAPRAQVPRPRPASR